MAKHRRKKSTKHRKSISLSSGGRKHHRRRRVSGGSNKIFKMVSDPLIGGLAGGLAAVLIGKLVKKFSNNNEMAALAAPLVIGFLLKKKAPALSSGMVAVPLMGFLSKKIPMLSESNMVSFADPLLLAEPLILSEQGYTLQEEPEEVYTFDEYETEDHDF